VCLACPPVESNTLELSTTLLCNATWLSFLKQLILSALSRNPPPELGVCSVLLWHVAVAKLYLVFEQLLKPCAPNGFQISLGCLPVETSFSVRLPYDFAKQRLCARLDVLLPSVCCDQSPVSPLCRLRLLSSHSTTFLHCAVAHWSRLHHHFLLLSRSKLTCWGPSISRS